MKRFLIWILVLAESGFANLNRPIGYCARDKQEFLGHGHRVCGGDQHGSPVAFIRALNCLKLGGALRDRSCTHANRHVCSLRMSYEICNISFPISGSSASILESTPRGLSLDWVAESPKLPLPTLVFQQSHHTPHSSSHRPGFEVPNTWREGVHYDFGTSHRFTRGETVTILFSDGSLRFGRIDRIPRGTEPEYMVQVWNHHSLLATKWFQPFSTGRSRIARPAIHTGTPSHRNLASLYEFQHS
jgi:hypothetical protein